MVYDWEDFEPYDGDDESLGEGPLVAFYVEKDCPLHTQGGYPTGQVNVRLITTFDNSTWWAWCYDMERFLIVTVTMPDEYLEGFEDEQE